MGFALNETFAAAPPPGYTTRLGAMTDSHNSAEQSLDLAATNSASILRFNLTAPNSYWFEADVQFLTNPAGNRQIGLWMTTGNGSEGYRFARLSSGWEARRWSSAFGDGALLDSVADGNRPMSDSTAVAPTFNVGQRRMLRCDVTVGAFNHAGVPLARFIQFSVAGVRLFVVNDATYPGRLVPGVFLFGATARLHAIAGAEPSALPALPAALGARAGTELQRLHSPISDRWDTIGAFDNQFRALPSARYNAHFSGPGFIAGTVKEKGQPDQPMVRRVQLHCERSGLLVAETWSKADGTYRFDHIDPARRYMVIGFDHAHLYRAVIADNLQAEVTP